MPLPAAVVSPREEFSSKGGSLPVAQAPEASTALSLFQKRRGDAALFAYAEPNVGTTSGLAEVEDEAGQRSFPAPLPPAGPLAAVLVLPPPCHRHRRRHAQTPPIVANTATATAAAITAPISVLLSPPPNRPRLPPRVSFLPSPTPPMLPSPTAPFFITLTSTSPPMSMVPLLPRSSTKFSSSLSPDVSGGVLEV